MARSPQTRPSFEVRQGPLQYIAFWQFLAFVMLVCLVWVNAVLDLAALIYGRQPEQFDWVGASILTAGVIIVGFISIAHTYQQQKRALKGIIRICSYCKKVQINEEAWQLVDAFVSEHTMAEFTHGVCPDCYQKLLTSSDKGTTKFVKP